MHIGASTCAAGGAQWQIKCMLSVTITLIYSVLCLCSRLKSHTHTQKKMFKRKAGSKVLFVLRQNMEYGSRELSLQNRWGTYIHRCPRGDGSCHRGRMTSKDTEGGGGA